MSHPLARWSDKRRGWVRQAQAGLENQLVRSTAEHRSVNVLQRLRESRRTLMLVLVELLKLGELAARQYLLSTQLVEFRACLGEKVECASIVLLGVIEGP